MTSYTKKIVMAALLAVVPALVSAQDYTMYETMYLKPDAAKWAELMNKLAAHNKKFHATGPYRAHVQRVVNGPRTGQLVWVMGPCTFTHLDSRPSGRPARLRLDDERRRAPEGCGGERVLAAG